LKHDLGLSDAAYGLGVSLFFIGYILLEVPSTLLLRRIGARKTVTRIMLLWGLASTGMMFVSQPSHFYVLRFLLGVAEGGMLPVVLTMVSHWFPDRERGRANAMVILFVPLAGMITAPLSGFILAAYDWHRLFFCAGALSLLCLVVWMLFADDGPETARWVSPREKAYILDALRDEQERKRAAGTPAATSFGALLR
ncbi:MFS transporter, partial [Staphylococcus lugdunensis]|nr:MFS transporter [Staphylococcus lugdunensis]